MKAVLVEVEFPEAVFTIHYTKGFRETYPIPLPTSVAGMFGAMLGIYRRDMPRFIRGKLFGAKMVSYKGITRETFTYVKYKDTMRKGGSKFVRSEWGVGFQTLVNNPRYLIALAASEDEAVKILDKIDSSLEFLPYGGMNDHPATDIKVLGEVRDVSATDEVEGFAPETLVIDIFLEEGGEVYKYPVRYRGTIEQFYFVVGGKLKLGESIEAVEGIPLYSLDRYEYQVI